MNSGRLKMLNDKEKWHYGYLRNEVNRKCKVPKENWVEVRCDEQADRKHFKLEENYPSDFGEEAERGKS